jgi:flap endonuclease-1
MGIKDLNRVLRSSCPSSIKCISASDLSGKKIAVDVSIYLYKFHADDALIENIYLMLAMFRYYGIIPIFIFDGKPPAEKKALLAKRRMDKQNAESEYNRLKEKLCENDVDDEDRQEIVSNMDLLKKQFVYITKDLIEKVKTLIRSYGATCYDAPGEADELCAMLVIKKKVYACLSEDMDMFVYGAPKVLRYMSLIKHTFVCYDMKGILDELSVSQKEFREICIISGTDYNICNSRKNDCTLHSTLKLFKKYKKSNTSLPSFYDWLLENSNYIQDYEILIKLYDVFDLSDYSYNLKLFEKIKIVNGPIQKNEFRKILESDGFIFPSSKI